MNSLIQPKTVGRGLVLISALFLLHANNALAAEFVDDAQMQARDLLSGTVGGRAKIIDESRAIASDSDRTSSPDPQEQARQLILGKQILRGKPTLGGTSGRAVDQSSYGDPQESARRMILGYGAGGTAASAVKRASIDPRPARDTAAGAHTTDASR